MGTLGQQGQVGFQNRIVAALQAGNVIINSKGLFAYNGKPTFGNLIESAGVKTAALDNFGNAYLSGETSYQPGAPWYALQKSGFTIGWLTAPGAGGPWTSFAQLIPVNNPTIAGISTAGTGAQFGATSLFASIANYLQEQGAAPAVIAGWQAIYAESTFHSIVLPALNIGNLVGKHFGVDASGTIFLIGGLTTDVVGVARIPADTNNRWQINANGDMQWGSGSAATDVTLSRPAAGELLVAGTFGASPVQSLISSSSNTVAEAVIASFTIPANDAQSLTSAYEYRLFGNINATLAMNVTLRLRIGGLAGNLLATFGPFTVRGLINGMGWALSGTTTCRGNGAGGHFDTSAILNEEIDTAAASLHSDITSFVAQDTTVSYTIVLTAQMSAAAVGNVAQVQEANLVRFSH